MIPSNLAVLIAIAVLVLLGSLKRKPRSVSVVDKSRVPPIDPSWRWETQEPLPMRPFVNKKNFNVQMGIKNINTSPQDWLLIEKTYKETVEMRKEIAQAHKTVLITDSGPTVTHAVREMYDTMVQYFLARYPHYFILKSGTVTNLITGESMPHKTQSETPQKLMDCLLGLIEEDFLLLIKDEETGEYVLRASITGFPNGFDPAANMGKSISQIHVPVPQYVSRLKKPMGGFFSKLNPKDLWLRSNWSIQTHNHMFTIDGNHMREGEEVKSYTMSDIDFENGCYLRVERQCFLRLPESKANLMTVRTYVTPIKTIKEEGNGPELIRAIDSLPEEIGFYKRRGVWGEAVKEYLAM